MSSTWRTPVLLPPELARDGEVALTQMLCRTDGERPPTNYYTRGHGWAGDAMESLRVALRPAWSTDSDLCERVDGWHRAGVAAAVRMVKSFAFADYAQARAFAAKVAALAEVSGRYPQILLERERVTLWCWTPGTEQVEDDDVSLAREVDALYQANPTQA